MAELHFDARAMPYQQAPSLDLAAIRQGNPLPEVAARHVSLKLKGSEWTGCCPFHNEKSPSFTIFDGGERFHCFGCGASGDVLDFVQRAYGVALPEAARLLAGGDVPKTALPAAPTAEKVDRSPEARALWEGAGAAEGTPAQTYLRFRGITIPPPPSIRFAATPFGHRGHDLPCLIAAVQDVAGIVQGVQRIYVRPDGSGKADVPKPKLSLGRITGGAIRIGELGAGDTLLVCEGPEDGLSLHQMTGRPVWVAVGASNLRAMQFPPEVREIIIGADNDPAGDTAAHAAADAFAARGLAVRIVRPLEGCKDFNDELKGARS